MSHIFDELKKSFTENASPELIDNLIEELKIFFQMTKVKLMSQNPQLAADAAADIAQLKVLLEQHPVIIEKMRGKPASPSS